jgi:hypothetical protein
MPAQSPELKISIWTSRSRRPGTLRPDRSNPDSQIVISMAGCIAWRVSLTSMR